MEKALIKRLVLPLTTLFVLALAIHARWDWDGFLLSLAVQLLGILLTVAYVDYILRVHDFGIMPIDGSDRGCAGTQGGSRDGAVRVRSSERAADAPTFDTKLLL